MRFQTIAVLCALAAPTVDAFGAPRSQFAFSRAATAITAKSSEYDFVLTPTVEEPKGKKAKKAAPAPVAASAPAPAPVVEEKKAEKPKKEKKEKKEKAPKVVEAAKPVEVVKTFEVKKVAEVVKAEAKAVTKDANALPIGIALGGAPLILAPLIALTAARSTLTKTKARRDEISRNIEEFEALEAIRLAKKSGDVDGGTLFKAVVSTLYLNHSVSLNTHESWAQIRVMMIDSS